MKELTRGNKIDFIIYDEPLEVENVYEQFPEGGVILYKRNGLKNIVIVYIKYKTGIADILYYFSRFVSISDEYAYKYHTLEAFFVIPTREKTLFWKKPLNVSIDYFYCNSFLCEYFNHYKSVHKENDERCSEEECSFLFNRNDQTGMITIYGCTNTEITCADREKLSPYVCVARSLIEYNIERELYLNDNGRNKESLSGERYESGVIGAIRKWLDTTSFSDFCQAITARVRGQKNTKKILANVYSFLECIASGKKHNSNMLLAAPSGCGKTETYRAVRDYFNKNIPGLIVYQYDMTSLTEEGYRGNNKLDMVKPLCDVVESERIAIAFLDEFDKKLMPSYSAGGVNTNAAVQAQILTIIEGSNQNLNRNNIDTGNIMFIGMGAFDTCRKKRSESKGAIGFGFGPKKEADHYDEITREDMIELGASYELIGRFSSIINYYALDYESVDQIIDDMCRLEGESLGLKFSVSDTLRSRLHANANGKFGCRLLRSIIHDRAMDCYIEVLENKSDDRNTVFLLDDEDEDDSYGAIP